jgi:hypothetical protein
LEAGLNYFKEKVGKMKIFKIIITMVLAITLIMSTKDLYAKSQSVSKSLTITLRVIPRNELILEESVRKAGSLSLNSKELEKTLTSREKDLTIERLHKNGVETILVTKVSE